MISEQTKEYFELGKRHDVRESAKRLRRQYLRYNLDRRKLCGGRIAVQHSTG